MKKISIINMVLVFLPVFLPTQSLTTAIDNNIKATKSPGLYLGGQYKISISHFKNFSVHEPNKAVTLVGLKHNVESITDTIFETNTNFNVPYRTKFKNNFTNFSGTIGYYSDRGIRLEIEGSYAKFDIKNPGGYAIADAYRYFALAREMDTTANTYQPKNKESVGNNEKYHYTVMKNNGISIASIMINACYDFSINNIVEISPYICAGIGEDFIEFFETTHVKFAYQGKVGISYTISPLVNLFADVYYHKAVNNQFKNLYVKYVNELKDSPKITSTVAKLNIGHFGSEIGVRFIF